MPLFRLRPKCRASPVACATSGTVSSEAFRFLICLLGALIGARREPPSFAKALPCRGLAAHLNRASPSVPAGICCARPCGASSHVLAGLRQGAPLQGFATHPRRASPRIREGLRRTRPRRASPRISAGLRSSMPLRMPRRTSRRMIYFGTSIGTSRALQSAMQLVTTSMNPTNRAAPSVSVRRTDRKVWIATSENARKAERKARNGTSRRRVSHLGGEIFEETPKNGLSWRVGKSWGAYDEKAICKMPVHT